MTARRPRPQRQLRAPTTTVVRPPSVLSADHHARLARRLTPRDRWLIRMLHEHRVLTTDTVTTMAFPSSRSARQRLLELYQWDVLDRFQPLIGRGSVAMHYVLGGAGAAVLAAEHAVTVKALGYRRDDVLAIAHRHTLAHTVAINELFAHLIRHTLTAGDVRLVAWWSETRCARYVGDLARPDAYGRITLPAPDHPNPAAVRHDTRSFEWFFELDFGTEPLTRVSGKLEGYAQLAAATAVTAPVLIWLPSRRREANARDDLARALRRLDRPDLVRVATTSPLTPPEVERETDRAGVGRHHDQEDGVGPGDRVWLPLQHPATSANGRRGRIGLADLAALWPAAGHSHARLITPGVGRIRRGGVVELPAPHPIPPDTDTFNPAAGHPPRGRAGRPRSGSGHRPDGEHPT